MRQMVSNHRRNPRAEARQKKGDASLRTLRPYLGIDIAIHDEKSGSGSGGGTSEMKKRSHDSDERERAERIREAIDYLEITGWLEKMVSNEDQARARRMAARKIRHGRN